MDFKVLALAKNYTDKIVTETGLKGKDGADGKSAYQYALDGGYQGTEQEFMQLMASSTLEVYTVSTKEELPSLGNANYIYRVSNDASLFQWNGLEYELLGGTEIDSDTEFITIEDIDEICGQSIVAVDESEVIF